MRRSNLICKGIFFLKFCFKFPFALFTGIPRRGRYESHNICGNRIFCFLILVVPENWNVDNFAPAMSFQVFLRVIFKIIYQKINVQSWKSSQLLLFDTINRKFFICIEY